MVARSTRSVVKGLRCARIGGTSRIATLRAIYIVANLDCELEAPAIRQDQMRNAQRSTLLLTPAREENSYQEDLTTALSCRNVHVRFFLRGPLHSQRGVLAEVLRGHGQRLERA
jgi:hypothetical protein